MKNLHRLEGTDPHLRKISITDDHTIAERKEISTWITKAKERTAADTDGNVWKIRGSPHQNNLRLIKITNTTTKTNDQPRPNNERFIEACEVVFPKYIYIPKRGYQSILSNIFRISSESLVSIRNLWNIFESRQNFRNIQNLYGTFG